MRTAHTAMTGVLSVALALGACGGGDRLPDRIARRITADAEGAVAVRGVIPGAGAALRIDGVSLEATGLVSMKSRFCLSAPKELAPCSGASAQWRAFDILIDPATVDAKAIGVDRVASGWGDGLMVTLPCREGASCVAGPAEPDKDRAPGDFISHGLGATAAGLWAKTMIASREGTDKQIDPWAKADAMGIPDEDYVRRFEAASLEAGPAAIPCASEKVCARIAKNLRRLITRGMKRKQAVERNSVEPDALSSIKPSSDLVGLAEGIAADERGAIIDAQSDAGRKTGPAPLEPVDIDVMPKPATHKNGAQRPDDPPAGAEAAGEILARLNKRMRGTHYSGPLGTPHLGNVDLIVDAVAAEPGFVVIRNVACSREPQRCEKSPFSKQLSPTTLRIPATVANAAQLGLATAMDKAPPPYKAVILFDGEFELNLKPEWLMFFCLTLRDCQHNRDDLLALFNLAGEPGFVAPPSSPDERSNAVPAPGGGSVGEILGRVNAAIKDRYILFTAGVERSTRGQYMAPAFNYKDGALVFKGMARASPYTIDLAKVGAESVGAPTREDGGAEFRFVRFSAQADNPYYVHLKADGLLKLQHSGEFIEQGEFGISAPEENTGPPVSIKLTDFTFECGTKAACETFANDLRALIAAVKAERAYGVDIAGQWELYAPSPQGGFARWTLEFRSDGSYVFRDTANGASHAGRYTSSGGKWSLSGHWTANPVLPAGAAYQDGGAYKLLADDALELTGRHGTGVWRRVDPAR